MSLTLFLNLDVRKSLNLLKSGLFQGKEANDLTLVQCCEKPVYIDNTHCSYKFGY